MLEEGTLNGVTRPPARELISQWSFVAMESLSTEIVKNSWRHGDYTWFPEE